MEFWITIVGLLRRKWVVIPAVLMALALGAVAYVGTAKTYVSSTTMVLTMTKFGGTESGDPAALNDLTNPLLNFSDSLRTTSAILIQAMNNKDVALQLGVRKPTELVVDDGRTNPDLLGLNGPFLFILVQSTSPDETSRLVLEAQELMRQKLREWQSSLGAPQKTFVSLIDVVPPTAPELDQSRAIKLGVIASIFGAVLSLGIAYFLHQRWARRRARSAAAQALADATPPPREGPEEERVRRRPRSPVLCPEGDAEPGVVPATLEWAARRYRHRVAPAPRARNPQRADVAPTPERKPEPAVVPESVTRKVWSRNP